MSPRRRAKRHGPGITVLALLGLVPGCDRDVLLGLAPTVRQDAAGAEVSAEPAEPAGPFSADMETGDLSQWFASAPSAQGTVAANQGGKIEVTSERAHGGKFSFKATVTTPGSPVTYARAFRQGVSPKEARYAAWFFLPQVYKLDPKGGYWHIMQFAGSEGDRLDGSIASYVFDLNVDDTGALELSVFDHIRRRTWRQASPVRGVPVGQWFLVEATLRYATDNTGWLRIALDGMTIIDIQGVSTATGRIVNWNLGNLALEGAVSPTPVVLFVDDASITPVSPSIVAR